MHIMHCVIYNAVQYIEFSGEKMISHLGYESLIKLVSL